MMNKLGQTAAGPLRARELMGGLRFIEATLILELGSMVSLRYA